MFWIVVILESSKSSPTFAVFCNVRMYYIKKLGRNCSLIVAHVQLPEELNKKLGRNVRYGFLAAVFSWHDHLEIEKQVISKVKTKAISLIYLLQLGDHMV